MRMSAGERLPDLGKTCPRSPSNESSRRATGSNVSPAVVRLMPASCPGQQFAAQGRFELLHPGRNIGLNCVQSTCCLRDTARSNNLEEYEQIRQEPRMHLAIITNDGSSDNKSLPISSESLLW